MDKFSDDVLLRALKKGDLSWLKSIFHEISNEGLYKEKHRLLRIVKTKCSIRDEEGQTLLHYLAEYNKGSTYLEIANYLLEMKFVDYTVISNNGNTAVHIAAKFNNFKVIRLICNRIKLEERQAFINIKNEDIPITKIILLSFARLKYK